MKQILFTSFFCVVFAGSALADITPQLQEASEKVQPVMADGQQMLADGRIEEMNQRILAVFPEQSRTAVQALMLGNILFKHDPKTSYLLHKRAAAELPDEPLAQLEWAMEQHRAGEWAAAAETYANFIKAQPDFGPALGMQAECLIRSGKTREAADSWLRSERGHGSLEQLESWVCEVHTHSVPDRERAAFFAKAKAGDINAAQKLVALDCNFEHDWWNAGPQESYLRKDLELLNDTKFSDDHQLNEIRCAAECGVIVASENGDAGAILRKYGFLLDEKATIPQHGRFASTMLEAALSSHALSKSAARETLGPAILAAAKKMTDAEMYNAAAHLYLGTDQLEEIDRAGWEATGDARFAASFLVALAAKDALTLDDARLKKAVAQFPESSEIARIVVRLSSKNGKPSEDALVNAIKAEYSHFSANGLIARPSAAALRAYFKALSQQFESKPKE